jgi:hypothetical protein
MSRIRLGTLAAAISCNLLKRYGLSILYDDISFVYQNRKYNSSSDPV